LHPVDLSVEHVQQRLEPTQRLDDELGTMSVQRHQGLAQQTGLQSAA